MRPLLTKHQVAELLGMSVDWVERETSARRLPIVPLGRAIRYDPADIEAYVEARKQPALGPRPKPGPPQRPTPPPQRPRPPAAPPTLPRPAGPPRRAAA